MTELTTLDFNIYKKGNISMKALTAFAISELLDAVSVFTNECHRLAPWLSNYWFGDSLMKMALQTNDLALEIASELCNCKANDVFCTCSEAMEILGERKLTDDEYKSFCEDVGKDVIDMLIVKAAKEKDPELQKRLKEKVAEEAKEE